MTNYFFTVSSKTVNFIMMIANSFNASTVKNIITLLKFVMIFRNVISALYQNTVITTAHSKTVSLHITVSIIILSIQLDSSSTEFTKSS